MSNGSHSAIVRIESLAPGGDGIGRLNGKACFVPLSAPGDLVRVRIADEKKNFVRCEIEELVEPGQGRIEPVCALFGKCGGCQWLHVSIEEQLKAKRRILARALGMVKTGEADKIDVLSSPRALGYRSSARFHFDFRESALGFVGRDMKRTIDVGACPVLVPELDRLLPVVREELVASVRSNVEIRLASGLDGVAALIISAGPLPEDFYRRFDGLAGGRLKGALVSIDGMISTLAGDARVRYVGGDGEPIIEPVSSFGQANRGVNELVGRTVSDWVGEGGFSSALELFAGSGNLTVVVARHVSKTNAVETDPASCRAAHDNITARGLKKTTVIAGDALEIYDQVQAKFDLAVLDPPRIGCKELAAKMAKGAQRAVLYVSCNPATLERDVRELTAGGFRLAKVLGFDMFPQTSHVEAAVLMER